MTPLNVSSEESGKDHPINTGENDPINSDDGSDVEILYKYGECIVANKPAGLLTQAAPGVDSIEVRLKRHLQNQDKDKSVYLGVPHRLDRPVSGAMVFGTDKDTTRHLSQQFEYRSVQKTYWAVVQGKVSPLTGKWSDYMRKIPGQAVSEIVPEDHPDAQYALLKYRVIQQIDTLTWLEIELETGRTHQIRLQSASRGHAILGDELYGSEILFGQPEVDERLRKIALHARKICFDNPRRKKRVCIDAPLPKYWNDVPLLG